MDAADRRRRERRRAQAAREKASSIPSGNFRNGVLRNAFSNPSVTGAYRPDARRPVYSVAPVSRYVAPRIPSFREAFRDVLSPSGLRGSARQSRLVIPKVGSKGTNEALRKALAAAQTSIASRARKMEPAKIPPASSNLDPTRPFKSPSSEALRSAFHDRVSDEKPVRSTVKARVTSNCKERPEGYHAKRAGGSASKAFIPWCDTEVRRR